MSDNKTSDEASKGRRHARVWAVSSGIFTALALLAGAFLYGQVVAFAGTANERGYVIVQQDSLIGSGCKLAGGKVNQDPELREACARVAQGKPAVPADVVAGLDGEPGVGIKYTRQVDRCHIEVGLTDGAVARYGSFCGRDGATGPTGTTGLPGDDGADGEPGVGVADVRASGCSVDVILTDGTVRTVGPFCGPPVAEYTVNEADGSAVRCRRDGGSDTAPVYTCEQTQPPTTTSPEPTTTSPEPTATETVTQTETTTETQTETETALPEPTGLLPTR